MNCEDCVWWSHWWDTSYPIHGKAGSCWLRLPRYVRYYSGPMDSNSCQGFQTWETFRRKSRERYETKEKVAEAGAA